MESQNNNVQVQRPLFSIITVCYNSEKTIQRTIESVLAQRFADYEYIIIDGKSKDGTMSIVKLYEDKFNGKLSYVSEPDKGIYDAFNKGVSRAKGEFIWIVNSDDYIESGALKSLSAICKDNVGKNVIICGQMRFHGLSGSTYIEGLLEPDVIGRYANKLLMGIPHPSSVYSRVVYDICGLYDSRYRLSGDVDSFLTAYRAGTLFVPFNHVITNMSDGGVSNNLNWKIRFADFKLRCYKFTDGFFFKRIRYIYMVFRTIMVDAVKCFLGKNKK